MGDAPPLIAAIVPDVATMWPRHYHVSVHVPVVRALFSSLIRIGSKTAVGCIQKETAAASGQREPVLPKHTRDSPVASLTKFSTVPTTGNAEREGFPRVPRLAVRKGPTNSPLRLWRIGQE